MKRSACLVLLLALPLSLGARRSDPAERDELAAKYWTAIRSARSLDELTREDSLRRALAAFGEEAAAVGNGLWQVRRYELTLDRSDGLASARLLEVAARSSDSWAWPHFAYALALTRGPNLRVRSETAPESYFVDRHSLAAQRAPRALRQALRLDPGFEEAAYELARLALDLSEPALMAEAYVVIADLPAPARPEGLLLRSSLAHAMSHFRDAAALADSALAAGADSSLALYTKAKALLSDPNTTRHQYGEVVYRRSVQRLSEAAAEAQYRDLYPIITEREVQAWERAATLPGRANWLIGVWEIRAGMAGAAVHERMAAHFHRLHAARFQMPPVIGLGGVDLDVLPHADPRRFGLSPEGLMLVRHGDPNRVDRLIYCDEAIDTIPAPIRPSVEECKRIWRQRELFIRMSPGALRLQRRIAGRVGVPGDRYDVPFDEDLQTARELYAFRGDSGTAQVVAAIAVPALVAPMTAGGVTLDAELILVDTAARVVERTRGRTRFTPERAAGDLILIRSLPSVIRGTAEYRVVVSDAERRTGRVSYGRIPVRDFSGDSLVLSDIVLAPAAAPPTFVRGDVPLALIPARSYAPGEAVALYYEIYGLKEGDEYRIELELRRRPDGVLDRLRTWADQEPPALRLTFAARAEAPHPVHGNQELRTLRLARLEPGTYDMALRITDVGGHAASAGRVVIIDGRM